MDSIVDGRAYARICRASEEQVHTIGEMAVTNIADALHGMGVVLGLAPVGLKNARITGTAVTVDVSPGDGLYARAALSLCQPGDVLVINAHGGSERAVLGGTVCIAAKKRGVVGIVVDGAVRDIGEIEDIDIHVSSRSIAARSGTTDSGWGEINVPVAIGSVVVMPGDVIAADREGCVVIPQSNLDDVIASVRAVEAKKGRPEEIHQRTADVGDGIIGLDRAQRAMATRGVEISEDIYGF